MTPMQNSTTASLVRLGFLATAGWTLYDMVLSPLVGSSLAKLELVQRLLESVP